ncbi:MlaD family protein [Mycolicibacterium septicum]|uniref:MlaD family protein n=1 Tax=Mycolicibacterium septicum TaxID=98668 RepID=UPI0023614044|nr:MlaD family protein [Mycolicibacterium septicum]
MKLLRNPTLWGAAALVLSTVVALVAAWLYIAPPGQKTVTFYTTDAASIRPGDQVRVAGVKAGSVEDLTLERESHRVRVRARIDNDVFVGDQSQVEVRMLTVVGGYYVSVVSLGDAPLGSKPIPVERVTMPYSLMQTLAGSLKITQQVDPLPIKDALDQLQKGLAGGNAEALPSIIDAGNSLMSTIDRQRGQVTSILNFSEEYLQSLNQFGDGLRQLVRKAALAEGVLAIYGKQFGEGLLRFATVLDQIAPLSFFYVRHRDRYLELVRNWQEKARMWTENQGAIVRSLRIVRNKIERVLDAQSAPPDLLATDMCIPVPGSPC